MIVAKCEVESVEVLSGVAEPSCSLVPYSTCPLAGKSVFHVIITVEVPTDCVSIAEKFTVEGTFGVDEGVELGAEFIISCGIGEALVVNISSDEVARLPAASADITL